MSRPINSEFRGDHIRVVHPEGLVVSTDTTQALWSTIGDACRRFGCWKVLSTSPVPMIVDMRGVDAYHSAVQAMEAARGVTIGVCFPGFEPDETTRLFMLAAENRGVHVRFFDEEDRALRWLGIAPSQDDSE